jgi:hypothetical protein
MYRNGLMLNSLWTSGMKREAWHEWNADFQRAGLL